MMNQLYLKALAKLAQLGGLEVHKKIDIKEHPGEHAKWTVARFASQEDYEHHIRFLEGKEDHDIIYSAKEAEELFGIEQKTGFEPNLLLNEGINEMTTLMCSASGTKFDSTNSYIGVGDSTTSAEATQTGLQASTNKLYKLVDSVTYGTSQKATWIATFASGDANFAWNEFTVANGNSDSSKNMNRKVSSQGTKQSGQVWVVTLEITWS